MTDRKDREYVQQVFDHALSGVQEDPFMGQRVLAAAQEKLVRPRLRTKGMIILAIVLCLVMTAAVGIAWTVSRQYFEEVARMTLTSGDYEDWSLEEKRYMVQIMGKYGLIPEGEARRLARRSEGDIDTYMLGRYGAQSDPDNLGWISIHRIADVELGSYVHWSNETWIWYTDMMLEIGLWDRNSDIDIFCTPGDEAVPPETAVAHARQHLEATGVEAQRLDSAQVIWQYFTSNADTQRVHLRYHVTFLYPDQAEDHVVLLPDGRVESAY